MTDSINSTTDYPTETYGTSNNSAGFLPTYKVQTGVTRGTQTIANTDGSKITLGKIAGQTAFGIAFYDPNGNLISSQTGSTRTIYDGNGNVTLVDGLLEDGSYGLAFYDTSGNLIQKIVAGTTYVYDPVNGDVNVMQVGKLPDNTYGFAVAAKGSNVADGIS